MLELSWNDIQDALSALECDVSPAGVHGQIAAFHCRKTKPPKDFGLAVTVDDTAAWGVVRQVHQHAGKQLESDELEFELLLPDENVALWRRLEALGEWAECFLFGLSVAGKFDPKALSDDGQECLNHLMEISRIDPDNDELQGEEAEVALTELIEFLRIAVMTLYVEFRTLHTRH